MHWVQWLSLSCISCISRTLLLSSSRKQTGDQLRLSVRDAFAYYSCLGWIITVNTSRSLYEVLRGIFYAYKYHLSILSRLRPLARSNPTVPVRASHLIGVLTKMTAKSLPENCTSQGKWTFSQTFSETKTFVPPCFWAKQSVGEATSADWRAHSRFSELLTPTSIQS